MSATKPVLVSFKICPYVQRAAIVLQHKRVACDIEYIDLADPPSWFLDISPLKKVPLLRVGSEVLFESAVINEYLDEVYPPPLHPADPLVRARHRGWIEFGNSCMVHLYRLTVGTDEQEFAADSTELLNKFDQVEQALGTGPWFHDAHLSLVDAAYAPLLQRLGYLEELKPGLFDPARHRKILAWKNRLLALDSVRQSCVPDIRELYFELVWKRRGFISRFLDPARYGADTPRAQY